MDHNCSNQMIYCKGCLNSNKYSLLSLVKSPQRKIEDTRDDGDDDDDNAGDILPKYPNRNYNSVPMTFLHIPKTPISTK
jgi:hypothetical protein